MYQITGVAPAAQPFDLGLSIRFLAGFPPCAGDQQITDHSLTKGIALDGHAVVVRVTEHPDGVRYQASAPDPWLAGGDAAIGAWVSDYLGLRDDLSGFYARAAGDHPRFRQIVDALHGLHHVRFPSVVEAAVWFVLSQRSPRSVALTHKRRVTETYGRVVELDGTRYPTFPELADLVDVTQQDWRALVRNDRKAGYLVNVVAGIADVGVDFLRYAPYEDASAALRRIAGVGEFTAAAVLLRGLGRMDHVPLEMKSFDETARAVYGPGFDPARVRARYGDQLGYWSYYLKSGAGALAPGPGAPACPVAA